jgi:hypothetical protein
MPRVRQVRQSVPEETLRAASGAVALLREVQLDRRPGRHREGVPGGLYSLHEMRDGLPGRRGEGGVEPFAYRSGEVPERGKVF